MSQEALNQFRQLVLEDISLQERLRETPDRETFLRLVLQLGAERGCDFTAVEVQAAMQASYQAWLMRWV